MATISRHILLLRHSLATQMLRGGASLAGARSTVQDHFPPEAIAYKMHDPQWCLKQAEAVGPECHRLIRALFADRVLDNLRAAQGLGGRDGFS